MAARNAFKRHIRIYPLSHKANCFHTKPCIFNTCVRFAPSLQYSTRRRFSKTPHASRLPPQQQSANIDLSDLFSSDEEDSDHKDDASHSASLSSSKHQPYKLLISNLHENINASKLKALCSKYGKVLDIHLPMQPNERTKHRGFCYAYFRTQQQLQTAMNNINGMRWRDSVLRAEYADPDMPSSQTQNRANSTKMPSKNAIAQNSEQRHRRRLTEKNGFSEHTPIVKEKERGKLPKVTTVNLSGLPKQVTVNQIKRMFNGFGRCLAISVYEYKQLDETFMNAVVVLDLQSLNNNYPDVAVKVLKAKITEKSAESAESGDEHKEKTVAVSVVSMRRKQRNMKQANDIHSDQIATANLTDMLQE